ncbi:helix-turn-helix domain-containing protein [Bradyrhizobium japonicum]|uniref:helix-turn-helix domain-containing protein n=2 Tax=Bradyrhizobium japonicum TaxID=375 RepID=UPI0035C8FC00
MPTERLAMRRVRDVIRMKAAGLPSREIARRVGAAPSTVRLALRRFEAAGLSWPLPDDVTDTVLELRLFAKTGNGNRLGHRPLGRPVTLCHRRHHFAPRAHTGPSRHRRHRTNSVTSPQSSARSCPVTFWVRAMRNN